MVRFVYGFGFGCLPQGSIPVPNDSDRKQSARLLFTHFMLLKLVFATFWTFIALEVCVDIHGRCGHHLLHAGFVVRLLICTIVIIYLLSFMMFAFGIRDLNLSQKQLI